MRIKDVGALLLLAALWGGSFLFIRVTSPVFGPFLFAALRVGIAGAALLLYAAVTRSIPTLRSQARNYLIIGALNAAIPYALIGLAELHLTASLGVILNATTPLFTAIVAAFWLRDRLDLKKGIGLVLGVLGVAVIVGWSPLPVDGIILLSIGAALVAALSYGFAGVFSKIAFVGTPPLAVAIGQQVGASVLLFPLALPAAAIAPPHRPSGAVRARAGRAGALVYIARLPDLLLPDRQRRPDEDAERHLSHAGVRHRVGRALPPRTVACRHRNRSSHYPHKRRPRHRGACSHCATDRIATRNRRRYRSLIIGFSLRAGIPACFPIVGTGGNARSHHVFSFARRCTSDLPPLWILTASRRMLCSQ